jgi:hypothetical protein
MARVSILLITVAFFITVAPITGMGGYVSPSQNLEIRTWYDLDAVRNNLDGNYTLMNDLDSTTAGYEELASPSANEGKGWQPIAAYQPWADTTLTGFMGTFDGQGHQIRDLYVNRPDELGAGLFGEVGREGVIKGIRVVNANVTGDGFVGLFAVVDERGRIEDISVVSGTVTGEAFVGGLVGDNFYGVVTNSHFTGSANGNHIVGGLVGENSYGTVSDSYSTGSVTGNYTVGGLVGSNYQATVSNSYSTGSISGNNTIGGLVGDNSGTVSNCFWDTETSGQATSDGGMGKTTAEMKSIATFSGAGWNITAVAPGETNPACIWNIIDNGTYPFLTWQTYTSITLDQYSSTVISRYGLSLTLSLNSTTYHPGDQISVTIDERNILAVENNIHTANEWPVQGVIPINPCNLPPYPFRISILQGYYDAKSVASIPPLQLIEPAFRFCPCMPAIVSYDFPPWSDIAVVHTIDELEPPWSINMTAKVASEGFWTGFPPNTTFSNFTPGIYTVVGGDEWGALVVLHFTIA